MAFKPVDFDPFATDAPAPSTAPAKQTGSLKAVDFDPFGDDQPAATPAPAADKPATVANPFNGGPRMTPKSMLELPVARTDEDDTRDAGLQTAATNLQDAEGRGFFGRTRAGMTQGTIEGAGQSMQGLAEITSARAFLEPIYQTYAGFASMSPTEQSAARRQVMANPKLTPGEKASLQSSLSDIQAGEKPQSLDAFAGKFAPDTALYKAGAAVRDYADKVVGATPAEKASTEFQVAQGFGNLVAPVAVGVINPAAGVALGAGMMGTQAAETTATEARSKGASPAAVTAAADTSAAVNAALGMLDVGAVLKPIQRTAPGLMAWGATKLRQAVQSGVVFAGVGEAQEWLGTQIADAYYDPDKKYSPSTERMMKSFLTGAALGVVRPTGYEAPPKNSEPFIDMNPNTPMSPEAAANAEVAGPQAAIAGPTPPAGEPPAGAAPTGPTTPPPAPGAPPAPAPALSPGKRAIANVRAGKPATEGIEPTPPASSMPVSPTGAATQPAAPAAPATPPVAAPDPGDVLWNKVEAGDTKDLGKPSGMLIAAAHVKAQGGLQDRAAFDAFAQDYLQAKSVPELQAVVAAHIPAPVENTSPPTEPVATDAAAPITPDDPKAPVSWDQAKAGDVMENGAELVARDIKTRKEADALAKQTGGKVFQGLKPGDETFAVQRPHYTDVAVNDDGVMVQQDSRGARSIVTDGVRQVQSIRVIAGQPHIPPPTGQFLTADEAANSTGTATEKIFPGDLRDKHALGAADYAAHKSPIVPYHWTPAQASAYKAGRAEARDADMAKTEAQAPPPPVPFDRAARENELSAESRSLRAKENASRTARKNVSTPEGLAEWKANDADLKAQRAAHEASVEQMEQDSDAHGDAQEAAEAASRENLDPSDIPHGNGLGNHTADGYAAQAGTKEGTHEPERLDQPSEGPLAPVSTDQVQGTPGSRETEHGASGSGGTYAPGDDGTGEQRVPQPRSLGDGEGAIPIPAAGDAIEGRGQSSEPTVDGNDRGLESPAAATGGDAKREVAPSSQSAAGTPAGARGDNFAHTDADEIGKGGAKTKYRANVAAINTLRDLDTSNRVATREEQSTLSKWVGWGSLADAFERSDGRAKQGWEKEVAELKGLLTSDEYQEASASSRNAHYTSPEVVKAMWAALQHMGFNGGRLLEPSVGIGNFFGLMPRSLRTATALHGVEKDTITSGLAKHLYPNAKIARMPFQDYVFPEGHFDAVIGNPPFGSEKLYDPLRRDLAKFSIHNYFFARSIDGLKPGGVMAMVVTNRLLDGGRDEARQYLASKADLVGAIRLPNDAFKKNAGTEVTTDILFLRKRVDGEKANSVKWTDARPYTDRNGDTVPMNEYFHENPGMMLGEFGAYGSMRGPKEPALVSRPGQNTPALLNEAVSHLPKNIASPMQPPAIEDATAPSRDVSSVRVGSMFTDGKKVMLRAPDTMGEQRARPVEFSNDRAEQRVRGMVNVRDALTSLRAAQLHPDIEDRELKVLRKILNTAYDKFVKENGPLNSDANKRLFREDPSWPQVSALEDGFQKGISDAVAKKTGEIVAPPSARKAGIFTKRTQSPYTAPDQATSAKDALTASLSERGRLDLEYMRQLYRKSDEAILQELGDLVFDDPQDGHVTRDEYLSGNVKKKLAQAREAAQRDPRYQPNVAALEAVQPKDIPAVEISVKPGAHWLPVADMTDFARHVMDGRKVDVLYNPSTATWTVRGQHSPAAQTRFAVIDKHGAMRVDVADILTAAANQRSLVVHDNLGDGKKAVNPEATEIAKVKVAAVTDAFGQWIWGDDVRRERLGQLYNDTFNTDIKRRYDGSHLQLPGKVGDDVIKLRPTQNDAIWRIVSGKRVLLDHVVGAGKTFTMIGGAMELRRTGMAKKPMIVVPNHLVGQWAADFSRLYPNASVLAAGKEDFKADKRKRLFARIATGDWDAVIVPHSSLMRCEVEPSFVGKFIEEQIHDLQMSKEATEEREGKKSKNVKQIEDQIAKLREKMKRLLDAGKKDDSLYWGELGVDALFLDEAHEFKNLAYSTSMGRVAGLGTQKGSQKAFDLFVKTRHILETTGGRNVVYATGTPISNTMAEMFTMQRYLDYENLKAQGMSHFDAWARQYGQVVNDWELTPAGQYKMNARFAKFVNLPELMQRYMSFADVINRDDINNSLKAEGKVLPVPKVAGGKPQPVINDRSRMQAGYIGEPIKDAEGNETEDYPQGTLVYRADHLPKGPPQKGDDNMLKIMSDARKAALDMRLIYPDAPDEPGSKVNVAAKRIKTIYDTWHADKGVQLVFCDLSTPKGAVAGERERIHDLMAKADEGDDDAQTELDKMSPDELSALESEFSVYDDLKAKLIRAGIPANEIAFIHDAKTDIQKEDLFGKVRSGRVRVMMGSTSKMGAGMNVQERLVALHHMDAPWRPSDLEQREGRIIRQGNSLRDRDPENFEVDILRYATKGTLDSRMWQTLESKARFIEQVRSGALGEREAEDVGGEAANSAEMKAASSGNPLILEEMTLRKEIRSLESERAGHTGQQHRARDELRKLENSTIAKKKVMAETRLDLGKVPAEFGMTVGGTAFVKRAEAGVALIAAAKKMPAVSKGGILTKDVGTLGELTVQIIKHRNPADDGDYFYHALRGEKREYETSTPWELGTIDAGGLATRVWNLVNDLPGRIQGYEHEIAENDRQSTDMQKQLGVWPKESDLTKLKDRHAEVLTALRPKVKKPEDAAKPSGDPTATPAFKAWFGDSKVVDAAGKPLRVYHGTPKADFDSFNAGSHFGSAAAANDRLNHLNQYPHRGFSGDPSNALIPVYLSIKNPKRVQDAEDARAWQKEIEQAKAEGHDGLVYRNDEEGGGTDSYVTFDPEQIKSAIGNSGAFNPADPRIANMERDTPLPPKAEPTTPAAVSQMATLTRAATEAARTGAVKRGATAIIERMRLQARLDMQAQGTADRGTRIPAIDFNEAREVEDFIDFVGHRMFDTVGMRIMAGTADGPLGSFNFGDRVVQIFRRAIKDGSLTHTAIHELWHSLEESLSPADRAAVHREFVMARERWLNTNPWARPFVRGTTMTKVLTAEQSADWEAKWGTKPGADRLIVRSKNTKGEPIVRMMSTTENYRFTNRDEYFAETMTDRYFADRDIRDEKARSIIAHGRDYVRKIGDRVKQLWGNAATGRIFEGFRNGDYAPVTVPQRAGEAFMARTPGAAKTKAKVPAPPAEEPEFLTDANGMWRAAAEIKAALSPTSFRGAKATEQLLRAHGGNSARSFDQAIEAMQHVRAHIDRLPVAEQLEFTHRMELGEPQPTRELSLVARTLRGVVDDWTQRVQGLGKGYLSNAIDDYMGHMWSNHPEWSRGISGQQKQTASEARMQAQALVNSKHPLRGGARFLKERTFPTQMDGIAAGLIPVTTNPIDMQMLKLREMQKFYYGTKLAEQMKDTGIAQFVRSHDERTVSERGLVKLDDKVFQPKMYSESKIGPVDPGSWYAPEPAARIFNNYMSSGWAGKNMVYDAVRGVGNALNALQLGLSGFHATFVTFDTMFSRFALGLQQAAGGKVGKGLASMATFPLAPGLTIMNGAKLRRAWVNPAGSSPEWQRIANLYADVGGRTKMEGFYKTDVAGSFIERLSDLKDPMSIPNQIRNMWGEAHGAPGVAMLLPRMIGRVLETVNHPLMGVFVPHAKMGVFAELARDWLARNPGATIEEQRAAAIKFQDSVDNRMGQMVYDNLFWKKVGKDIAFLATRSVGWNLGTIRELGGAAVDVARGAADKVTGATMSDAARTKYLGRRPGAPTNDMMTSRVAYAVGMSVVSALIGGILTYLFTGKGPESLLDYYFPRTGGDDDKGNPNRISLPGYVKDVVDYVKSPVGTLINKLHPLFGMMRSILVTNRDFFGGTIYNAQTDNAALSYLEYTMNESLPLSIRQYLKGQASGLSPARQFGTAFGFVDAPKSIVAPERGDNYQRKQDQLGYRRRLKDPNHMIHLQ